jgi:hypothetical protein
MPDEPNYIRSEDFYNMADLELITLYVLLEDHRLPTKYINKHLHIDINDKRAKCWLSENKPKDLF